MGYIIKDNGPSAILGSKRQSLIKKTPSHLILINFDYRRRILTTPQDLRDQTDPEERRKLEPEPFSKWLRRHDLLPPDFATPEYDEENIMKDYDEVMRDRVSEIYDHEDDKTGFEICVINKRNQGILINAHVN